MKALIIFALLYSANTFAASYKFKSSFDTFTLKDKGSYFSIGKYAVDVSILEPFFPLFKHNIFSDKCPSKKPDLQIVQLNEKESKTLSFFFKDSMISDGKGCYQISGKGIHYLPLHRKWFLDDKKQSIHLGKKITFSWPGNIHWILKKEKVNYSTTEKSDFVHWSFLEQIVRSLKNFPVQNRVSTSILLPDSLSFKIKTKNRTYTFYRLYNNSWALKYPKSKWLIVSPNWTFLNDLNKTLLNHPQQERLLKLTAKDTSAEDKRRLIKEISPTWDADIRRTYLKLLYDSNTKSSVKVYVLKKLKIHPTNEVIKDIGMALETETDPEVFQQIFHILRIKNPKGPKWDMSKDPSEQTKKIDQWKNWLKKL